MNELKKTELEEIKGGFSWTLAIGLSVVITFIIGVLEGYTNPKECNINTD